MTIQYIIYGFGQKSNMGQEEIRQNRGRRTEQCASASILPPVIQNPVQPLDETRTGYVHRRYTVQLGDNLPVQQNIHQTEYVALGDGCICVFRQGLLREQGSDFFSGVGEGYQIVAEFAAAGYRGGFGEVRIS